MKVSVIMIDGSFRENTFGAEYFTRQDFPQQEYEVIWVEFYERANEALYSNQSLKIITLNHSKGTTYHSSLCFNEGIKQANGELLIIPDADVIVESDFIQKAWECHQENDELVAYGYRYNEVDDNKLNSLDLDELKEKCIITNPINYGGCLTVRKKWILEVNGYDQHDIFKSGFHANGLDMYTRFRNYGLSIKWAHSLKLFHPSHAFTSEKAPEYNGQRRAINWRSKRLEYLPFSGIDSDLNTKSHFPEILNDQISPKSQKVITDDSSQNNSKGFIQKIKKRLFK